MTQPKITGAIVCDDIRHEVTGKQIIIGVYNTDMRLQALPVTITLCLWAQVENLRASDSKFEFRCDLAGKTVVSGDIGIKLPEGSTRASLPIGPFPVTIEKAGKLRFSLKFEGSKKWQTATEIDVQLAEPPV